MTTQFGIIGNGSWATALAKMLTHNGNTIHWWMRNEQARDHFRNHHHNLHYLSSVDFRPEYIFPTTDLLDVLRSVDYLVICVPSAYVTEILQDLPQTIFEKKTIISAIKGILPNEHVLLNEYLKRHFDVSLDNYLSITGPCHAEEVAQERLSYLTFSGTCTKVTSEIAACFATPYIKTTTNQDIYGTQYAAVLKNIYAVGAGIAHGLSYGDNFLSVYITNCYREMFHFLKGQFQRTPECEGLADFHTSAYLGDLLVTCYSPHSRNRTFGTLLGKGYSINAATTEMNMVAEGYFASKGMQVIMSQLGIAMPIVQKIHEVLWEGKQASHAFTEIEDLLS